MDLVVGAFTPSVLLAVAQSTGRLRASGLAVTEVPVDSSPAQFRALMNGELDAALTSPDNVLAYRFDPHNPLGTTTGARIVSAVDRGMGLGLYAGPGLDGADLRGATVGVDVPTSGFALAMYALAESLGVSRAEYDVVALGSTPKRLDALLAGDCHATMLNAGNELVAEAAGAVALARVADVCAPYLGTVVSIVDDARLGAAKELAIALRATARAICDGTERHTAAEQAVAVLGLSDDLAQRYVERLTSPDEGLVTEDAVSADALATLVTLRRRYLPGRPGDRDVLADALAPERGLVVDTFTVSG